jgi:DNA-binding phage protein
LINDLHVLDILNEMRHQHIESTFIFSLMESCQHYEGIRDLMELWFEETDATERDKIISDLQDSLDEILNAPQAPEERPYLRFDDLNEIRKDVLAFKERLRAEVDRQGGISELARKTGIPQSSLSRFFLSGAMPRRTTLFRIAKALNLPETASGFKWVR